MNKPIGFIYVTTCLVNNKKYIGKKNYNSTWRGNWTTYLGSSKCLNQDITKYGRKNFKREIIEECNTINDLSRREIYYQKLWNVKKDPNWYNLHIQGEDFDTTGLTWTLNEDLKKKLWPTKRRQKYSQKWVDNNPNYYPGVSKARSQRLLSGKQHNPFRDSQTQHKIKLKKAKPIVVESPEGLKVVFISGQELVKTLNLDANFLKKKKVIKQGRNKGWKWIGYTQLNFS